MKTKTPIWNRTPVTNGSTSANWRRVTCGSVLTVAMVMTSHRKGPLKIEEAHRDPRRAKRASKRSIKQPLTEWSIERAAEKCTNAYRAKVSVSILIAITHTTIPDIVPRNITSAIVCHEAGWIDSASTDYDLDIPLVRFVSRLPHQ